MKPDERIIVALDVGDEATALNIVEELLPEVTQFKVGMELFYAAGADFLRRLHDEGARVFLDLKLHDIPNTVAGAARVLSGTGVWMTNLHASGGPEMMKAAREALPDTRLLAVTVLTSLDQQIADEFLGMRGDIQTTVVSWAKGAQDAGLDGVVCSPQEIEGVRDATGDDFLIVTPGIRPTWSVRADDQRRITPPAVAISRGADYLVIGRPITGAEDRTAAVRRIKDELEGVNRHEC